MVFPMTCARKQYRSLESGRAAAVFSIRVEVSLSGLFFIRSVAHARYLPEKPESAPGRTSAMTFLMALSVGSSLKTSFF